MKKLVMAGFLMGVFLSSNQIALADENHQHGDSLHEEENQLENTKNHEETDHHEGETSSDHKESHETEIDHTKMTEEEHQESIKHEEATNHGSEGHEEGNSHSDEGDAHEESEVGGHGHGGENLVEKPANMKVLGTFGAINLSFVLIGIWNKWFKRKEGE